MNALLGRTYTSLRTVHGLTTPFVGRVAEVERLYAGLHRAARMRRLQHISVVGAPGVGKTRLVEEFLGLVEPRARSFRVYRCSVPSNPDSPAFSVLGQLVAQRFGIGARDTEDEVRSKLLSALVETVEPKRVHDAAHLLGALLELPYGLAGGDAADDAGDDVPRRAARLVHEMLQQEAEGSALAIVIDHWDLGSVAARRVSAELSAALAESPVLLLTCSREAVPGASLGPTEKIELPPLAPPVLERILLTFMPSGVPPKLASVLGDRSGGNPRLLENLVRLLIARGVLQRSETGYVAALDKLAEAPLPSTLTELARERVEALTGRERRVLTAAAVMGLAFWPGGVRSMLLAAEGRLDRFDPVDDGTAARVEKVLAGLVAADTVRPEARSTVYGEEQLAFVSPEERTALIERLDADELEALHRLAAQWMSGVNPHDPVSFHADVAAHFQQGGRSAGAARALLKAAAAARNVWDNARALALLLRAMELVSADEAALRGRVTAELGWMRLIGGDYTAAEQLYREAAGLAAIVSDSAALARATNHIGKILLARGRYEPARAALDRAFLLFEAAGDVEGVAAVREDIGKLVWHRAAKGAYKEAMEWFRQSLSLRRSLGDPGPIARSLTHIANIQGLTGRSTEAERSHREALELRRKAGDRRGECTTLNGLAVTLFERGDKEAAVPLWERALSLAVDAGDRTQYALVLGNIAEAKMVAGDLDEAERLLVEAEETAAELGNARILGYALQTHAMLREERGDTDGAQQKLDQAMNVAEETGNQHLLATCLRAQVQIAAARMLPDEDATMVTGTPAWAQDALDGGTRALAILEELGDLPGLHRSLDVQADLMENLGLFLDAQPLRARAREIRSQIGWKAPRS